MDGIQGPLFSVQHHRAPEQGDQRARTGAPMTVMLHDKGLSTDIDWQNKDYSGKTINSRYRSQFIECENGKSVHE